MRMPAEIWTVVCGAYCAGQHNHYRPRRIDGREIQGLEPWIEVGPGLAVFQYGRIVREPLRSNADPCASPHLRTSPRIRGNHVRARLLHPGRAPAEPNRDRDGRYQAWKAPSDQDWPPPPA